MSSKKSVKPIGLLPHYFKKIGAALLIIAFLISRGTFNLLNITVPTDLIIYLKTFSQDVFLIGLSFMAAAKDTSEDERSIQIRLKSIVFALLTGIITIIVRPFIDVLFGDPFSTTEPMSAIEFIIYILFCYLLNFYLIRFGENRKDRANQSTKENY
jgi:hypothetical protein